MFKLRPRQVKTPDTEPVSKPPAKASPVKATPRRSDEIRTRLSTNAHQPARPKPAVTPTRRTTRSGRSPVGVVSPPQGPPPVMARSSTAQTRGARRSTGGRRRFDLLLNNQGAEVRLPALPHVRFGWRVASFLMLVFLAAVLYFVWNSPAYRVDAAHVAGLQRISSGDVNRALGLTGKPVFTLDADQLRSRLVKSFPEFSAVQVAIQMPDTLMITVTERVPVLIWRQDGRQYLVDMQGVTFPARDGVSQGKYPVVEASGPPPALVAGVRPCQDAQATGSNAPVNGGLPCVPSSQADSLVASDPQLASQLPLPPEPARPMLSPEMVSAILTIARVSPGDSQLLYSPQHGFGWKDKRGWDVYLGSFEDVPTKLLVYRSILDHLKTAEGHPTLVSVEYAHAPYYRLEP